MRRSIAIVLVIVLVLTFIGWGVSYFLQPLLSPEINRALNLFFQALVGVTGVLGVVGFIEFFINYYGKGSTILRSEQRQRNRRNMLNLVWNTWVEGVLKKSLYNEVLIELGMETRPDAVEHPWDMVIQMPKREPRLVPPGTTALELFDQLNGLLLILGEPGSGKTTVLLELCRQTIERAKGDIAEPIPVIFNLSSWKITQTLDDWLVSELKDRYYISENIGRPWVENDELLVLLDGLDEVKSEYRETCTQAINSFLDKHNVSFAVCSRKQEYDTVSTHLKLRGAVLILPLSLSKIEEYLLIIGSEISGSYKALRRTPELHEVVSTPLMLNIWVLVYQRVLLHELEIVLTQETQRKLLLDAYVNEMFKRRSGNKRYTAELTISRLAWLAQRMAETRQMIFYIEDINSTWFTSVQKRQITIIRRIILGLIVGLGIGLFVGLSAWLGNGPKYGLSFGMGICLSAILTVSLKDDSELVKKQRWEWKECIRGLGVGIIYGPVVGLTTGLIFGPVYGLQNAFEYGLVFGLSFGLIGGMSGWLNNELRNGLCYGLSFGIVFGLSNGILLLQEDGLRGFLYGFLIGTLRNGLIFGLIGWLIYEFKDDPKPIEKLRWEWNKFRQGLRDGLIGSLKFMLKSTLVFGLVSAVIIGISDGPVSGLTFGLEIGLGIIMNFGLYYGLIGGLIYGILIGLSGTEIENRGIPEQGIRTTLQNAVLIWSIFFPIFGLSFGLYIGLGTAGTIGGLVLGLSCGLIFGLFFSLHYGGYYFIYHNLLRIFAVRGNHLPWNITDFLNYTTSCIFLRRVGGGYIFIHRMLMEHFAEMAQKSLKGK